MTFTITDVDLSRWRGQKRALLDILSDGKIHDRESLARASGATQMPSRISELRKDGWLIACVRYGAGDKVWTAYQIDGYTGEDNTSKRHCASCRCE